MIYDLIKEKVTHFSSELHMKPRNTEDVTVGGIIKKITPPINLHLESFSLEETGEQVDDVDFGEFYQLLIDDGLDELTVYISKDLYDYKKDFIEEDKVCIFFGITSTLSRKIGGEIKVDLRVFAYDVELAMEGCLV